MWLDILLNMQRCRNIDINVYLPIYLDTFTQGPKSCTYSNAQTRWNIFTYIRKNIFHFTPKVCLSYNEIQNCLCSDHIYRLIILLSFFFICLNGIDENNCLSFLLYKKELSLYLLISWFWLLHFSFLSEQLTCKKKILNSEPESSCHTCCSYM